MPNPRSPIASPATMPSAGMQPNWGLPPAAAAPPDMNMWGRLGSMGADFMAGLAGPESFAGQYLPRIADTAGYMMGGSSLGQALRAPGMDNPLASNLGSALFDLRGGQRIPLLFMQPSAGGGM